MLDVSQHLLHVLNGRLVACVLAHVVTKLDSRVSVGARDLDDDIEWF